MPSGRPLRIVLPELAAEMSAPRAYWHENIADILCSRSLHTKLCDYVSEGLALIVLWICRPAALKRASRMEPVFWLLTAQHSSSMMPAQKMEWA